MSKPTKITQVQPGEGGVSTCAPLPALINADGRSSNLKGTEGAFIAAGPVFSGLGFLELPSNVGALTADQVVGGFLTFTAVGGSSVINFPPAADIVKYITTQYTASYSAAIPNAGTAATPLAYYPTFELVLASVPANSYSSPTTDVKFFTVGTTNGASSYVPGVPNTQKLLKGVVINDTPGSEFVAYFVMG